MSQEDVYSFLKRKPNKWFTIKEISDKIRQSYTSTYRIVLKLYRSNEILKRELTRDERFERDDFHNLHIYKIREDDLNE